MPVQSPLVKRSRGGSQGGPSRGLSQEDSVTYGDIDGNGNITATDALLAQKAFLGQIDLTERQKKAADVNGDGMVNATDALLIEKYSLGEIDKFPVEKEEQDPQKVRNLRNDIASLETEIALLRPFDELPPWRRKRLKRAVTLADEANILVENIDKFTEAKTKYDEALRLFKDDTPPEGGGGSGDNGSGGGGSGGNGSGGGNGNGSNGGDSNGGGSNGSVIGGSTGGSAESEMFAGVDDTALVLGAGVAATGIIALVASG